MDASSKIYVAGHRGMVGSAVWNALHRKGYSNLSGRSSARLDLLDQAAVDNFFREEKPEYVVVAAARVGGIGANATNRGQFIYENTQIELNVIHAAHRHDVKKLLFLGLAFVVVNIPVCVGLILFADRIAQHLKRSPRLTRVVDWLFAGVLGAFAVRLLLAQSR